MLKVIFGSFFFSTVIAAPSDGKKNEQKDDTPVDIKLPVKHVLSRELQVDPIPPAFSHNWSLCEGFSHVLLCCLCSSILTKSLNLL